MKPQDREKYQYLEDLKMLCVFDEMVYIQHLTEIFGLPYEEALDIAVEFVDSYDTAFKKYNLDDLFPSFKWFDRQERLEKNADKVKWVLERIGDVKLTQIMRKFKMSRDEAVELMQDAVLGYGVSVSRMQFDVKEVKDDTADIIDEWE